LTDIYKLICDTLSDLGYPVKEQGTYGKDDVLPATFVTYQIIYDEDVGYYDNVSTATKWRVQVALYSKSPTIKQGANAAFKSVMLPAKFMRLPGGRDLPYSAATGHYGYTSDYRFYDKEE